MVAWRNAAGALNDLPRLLRWRSRVGSLFQSNGWQQRARKQRAPHTDCHDVLFYAMTAGDAARRFCSAQTALQLVPTRFAKALLSPSPLLIFAAERRVFRFAMVALVRGLAGRRTVGIIESALPLAVSRRFRHRVRRLLLSHRQWIRNCRTLALLPFHTCPRLGDLTDGWIYHPHLHDLAEDEREAVLALRAQRPVPPLPTVIFLAPCGIAQGFASFADLYTRRSDLWDRFQFIACGPVEPDMAAYADAFREAGGVVVDQVLERAEVLGVHAATDGLWCVPLSPDDAEVGRAVQFGVPLIVARGSSLHSFAIAETVCHVAIGNDPTTALAEDALPAASVERGQTHALRIRQYNQETLRAALGL